LTLIIEKRMKVDLAARYQTMGDVHRDLQACLDRSQIQSHAVSSDKPREGEAEVEVEFEYEGIFSYHDKKDEPAVESKPDPIPELESTPVSIPESAEAITAESVEADDDSDHLEFEIKAIQQKHILCVETQPEIQDAFRRSLTKMGYRVILVSDAELATERFRETTPEGVIFDIDGYGEEGLNAFLDMYDKARDGGHELTSVVLLGPKQASYQEKLPNDDRLVVFVKPIKMKNLQNAILQLVPVV